MEFVYVPGAVFKWVTPLTMERGWSGKPSYVRSADRWRDSPDARINDLGFRLVLQTSAPDR
ncbi:MAG: hypothetical protein A2X81_12850 [Desulfobacterales bacterium GWB2_56_26]|nr:MAG: hypothetical protein A2X81_12850 [Desulfobacterales bacterium GWB2_56_26]